jgi:hypothetical protein
MLLQLLNLGFVLFSGQSFASLVVFDDQSLFQGAVSG